MPFSDGDSLKPKEFTIAIPFLLSLGESAWKSKLLSICLISSEWDSWKGQSGWLQLHTSESVSSRSCLTSLRRSVISLVNAVCFFILSGVFTCRKHQERFIKSVLKQSSIASYAKLTTTVHPSFTHKHNVSALPESLEDWWLTFSS